MIPKVSKLIDLKTFCDENAKGRKFKGTADRKRYIKSIGLKLVKHPTSGEEMVPVHDATLMMTGHRKAAERVREEEFESKASAKKAYNKMQSDFAIQTNDKEPLFPYREDNFNYYKFKILCLCVIVCEFTMNVRFFMIQKLMFHDLLSHCTVYYLLLLLLLPLLLLLLPLHLYLTYDL